MQRKKYLFNRVKIDIINYLCVKSKFCRRFQDSNPQIWSQKKIKKDIIFIDYCRFVMRERNLFRERKWEVCVWREEERTIRREIDSDSTRAILRERDNEQKSGPLVGLRREKSGEIEEQRKRRWGSWGVMCV